MSEIRRLGGVTNAVIVKLPERTGPSIALQFDSLDNLRSLIREVRDQIENGNLEEATGVIDELDRKMSGYLDVFDNLGPGGYAELKPE